MLQLVQRAMLHLTRNNLGRLDYDVVNNFGVPLYSILNMKAAGIIRQLSY